MVNSQSLRVCLVEWILGRMKKKKEKKFFFEECLVGRGRGKRDGVWEFSPRVLQKFFSPKWGEN